MPLAHPFKFTITLAALALSIGIQHLDVSVWFIASPADKDTKNDQQLDSFQVSLVGTSEITGALDSFRFSFECPGPDLSKIPEIESLDITSLLIRIGQDDCPYMLIPFLVTVEQTLEGVFMRRLIGMKVRYDYRSPIGHPPPPPASPVNASSTMDPVP